MFFQLCLTEFRFLLVSLFFLRCNFSAPAVNFRDEENDLRKSFLETKLFVVVIFLFKVAFLPQKFVCVKKTPPVNEIAVMWKYSALENVASSKSILFYNKVRVLNKHSWISLWTMKIRSELNSRKLVPISLLTWLVTSEYQIWVYIHSKFVSQELYWILTRNFYFNSIFLIELFLVERKRHCYNRFAQLRWKSFAARGSSALGASNNNMIYPQDNK